MSGEYQYLLKFIVIGDTGVGKSSVVNQFVEQKINDNHQITIGVQFATRICAIGNKMVKFQVWDTAGQQNFRSITRSYYRSAIGAMLVYDITKRKTFQHLQEWLKQLRNNGTSELQILLIGNKNDLQDEREVSQEEGRNFAKTNGLQWIQVSARNYNKVETAFNTIASSVIHKLQTGQISENSPGVKISQNLRINPMRQKKSFCC